MSASEVPEGIELSDWRGLDCKSSLRCRHGRPSRCLLCWDGANTGRRYLGCPLKNKSRMCRFVKWVDDEWPPKSQEVAATLWDVVAQFKKKADDAQTDLLGAIQLRNEVMEDKEALLEEKEDWAIEKAALVQEKARIRRELSMRTRFARASCSTLASRINSQELDKKVLVGVILCLLGLLVAMMLSVVLKNK